MEILNYKYLNKNSLKSTFTVLIPEWGAQEIDCTYFEKENGNSWINFAAKEYTNKEGQKKSWNQVRWPAIVKEKLTSAIKEKIKTINVVPDLPQEIGSDEELPF